MIAVRLAVQFAPQPMNSVQDPKSLCFLCAKLRQFFNNLLGGVDHDEVFRSKVDEVVP